MTRTIKVTRIIPDPVFIMDADFNNLLFLFHFMRGM